MREGFIKVKCFGEKCALTAEIGTTSKQVLCINLEMAKRIQSPQINGTMGFNHHKTYDWKDKIIFQLDLEDMNLLSGVLLGFKGNYTIRRDEKELVISRQGKNAKYGSGIYFHAGDGLHLLISPGGAIELCQLLLKTIDHLTGCQPSYVLASIKGGCSLE